VEGPPHHLVHPATDPEAPSDFHEGIEVLLGVEVAACPWNVRANHKWSRGQEPKPGPVVQGTTQCGGNRSGHSEALTPPL
jgi:hypothetical protein